MTDATPTFADQVAAFIASAKVAAADGLTWQEFGQIVVELLTLCIREADTLSHATGPEKKAAVVEAVGLLFDAVADQAVPLAFKPFWFLLRPAVRAVVLELAAGAVEPLLSLVRSAQ